MPDDPENVDFNLDGCWAYFLLISSGLCVVILEGAIFLPS